MMEKLKVVICELNKESRIEEINAELEEYQRIVGGYIECIYPFDDNVVIVCNEEGIINGLPLNRPLYDENRIISVIHGTFFIVGTGKDDFISLTDEQAKKYDAMFKLPHHFVRDTFFGGLNSMPFVPKGE